MAAQSGKPASSAGSAPSLEALTQSNIQSILQSEESARQEKSKLHRIVERAAQFCGTLSFLGLNMGVFVAWILVNAFAIEFDPFPYTLLLFAVSIEAILLSILILISQNLSAIESERRHHLDLQICLCPVPAATPASRRRGPHRGRG